MRRERIVLAHSWKALVWKIVVGTVGFLVALLFIQITPADDLALFTDKIALGIVALATITVLIIGVFLVQLLFVAPFQLWREQWERAEAATKSKPKLTKPPKRDASLPAGLVYALNGTWDASVLNALLAEENTDGMHFRISEFEKEAENSGLTVWGKNCSMGIMTDDWWSQIKPSFWVKNAVSWDNLVLGGMAKTETQSGLKDGTDQYEDLMVSRSEFEERWPHGQ